MNLAPIYNRLELMTAIEREAILWYVDFAPECGVEGNPSSRQLKEGLHRRKLKEQRESSEELPKDIESR